MRSVAISLVVNSEIETDRHVNECFSVQKRNPTFFIIMHLWNDANSPSKLFWEQQKECVGTPSVALVWVQITWAFGLSVPFTPMPLRSPHITNCWHVFLSEIFGLNLLIFMTLFFVVEISISISFWSFPSVLHLIIFGLFPSNCGCHSLSWVPMPLLGSLFRGWGRGKQIAKRKTDTFLMINGEENLCWVRFSCQRDNVSMGSILTFTLPCRSNWLFDFLHFTYGRKPYKMFFIHKWKNRKTAFKTTKITEISQHRRHAEICNSVHVDIPRKGRELHLTGSYNTLTHETFSSQL